jgi:Spy/CpxP family protein refolding chaperone
LRFKAGGGAGKLLRVPQLYKTLCNFAKLYRTHPAPMLKSRWSKEVSSMKRLVIWSSVASLLVIAGILVVRAEGGPRHGWGRGGWCDGGGPLGYVAHELKLNDAQRAQIKTMWREERPAVANLVKELADESREMDAATAHGNLDDAKVQAVASRQGETIAKLLVEKEHFRQKVYANVLNQEQRDKADELLKTWHSRFDRIASRIENGDGNEPHK